MNSKVINVMMGLFVVAFGIAGCGGGGGSNTPNVTTVSGVAATGAPISGTAYIKDSTGTEKSQVINIDGAFSFVVDGLKAPFLLKAEWTPAGGTKQTLYSFATSTGTANINPIGHLAAISAAGATDISALYATPDASKLQMLATALPTAVSALRTGPLKPLFDQYANIDPIKDAFKADHTGFDKLLDTVTVTISQSGAVTISNKETGTTIYSSTLGNLDSGTFNQANLPSINPIQLNQRHMISGTP